MKWLTYEAPRVGYPPLVTPFSQYVKNHWHDERDGDGEGKTLGNDCRRYLGYDFWVKPDVCRVNSLLKLLKRRSVKAVNSLKGIRRITIRTVSTNTVS